jgi:hypothetical protein
MEGGHRRFPFAGLPRSSFTLSVRLSQPTNLTITSLLFLFSLRQYLRGYIKLIRTAILGHNAKQ